LGATRRTVLNTTGSDKNMKTSFMFLALQSTFAGITIGQAFPFSETPIVFALALLTNSVLLVGYGFFKAIEED
jgi:hypothetical protein